MDTVMDGRAKAQMEVAAIEVQGLLDELAGLMARYPSAGEDVTASLTRAAAELIIVRDRLIAKADR